MMHRPLMILVPLCMAGTAIAGQDCRNALSEAAAVHAVPSSLIDAVSFVESGYEPLSINADGTSYHPLSVDEAVRKVRDLQRDGARFIDVGCMQIDLAYHPTAFADLRAAFDPSQNSMYGARYLKENWQRWGNWTQAVAYFHSSDPLKQAAYVARVKERLSGRVEPRVSNTSSVAAASTRTVTVHLSMMTVTRAVSDARPIGGH